MCTNSIDKTYAKRQCNPNTKLCKANGEKGG